MMTRYFYLTSLAIVATITVAARADVTISENNDTGLTVIRMTVTPAAEPIPVLKYRMVARDMDQKAGNAAPYYYRAILEVSSAMNALRKNFNQETELDRWEVVSEDAMPIAQLPLEKVRKACQLFDSIYDSNLKPAFERNACDWQLNVGELRGPEVFAVHLNEFQDSRLIARILSMRTRLAIAERRYDEAVKLMRCNYRLGSDVAKVPFIVCGLIGIAIDGITNRAVVEFIANPDSPNLYWALGELPQPPIDLRPAIRFEMDFGPRVFPFIHNAEMTDHSPQEWNRLFTQTIRDLQSVSGSGSSGRNGLTVANEFGSGIAATAIGLAGYSYAKQQLMAQGMDRNRVENMAVGQVIAIYSERNYRRLAESWETLWQVPFAHSVDMSRRLEQELAAAKSQGGGENREVLPMGTLLLPALQASRQAQMRLDRDLASLRVIEALRIYVAAHDGHLPSTLDDVNEVPVPNNPATGKPFVYRVDGTTAILELPPADRLSSGNCRYEIQIATKK